MSAAETLVIPAATVTDQRRAADPGASAWVSANAGAGKTKVLTDRVVRLLLAGSPPARLLCLTFTKAAAANMAIRIFERLGRWVTMEEETLVAELTELEGERPDRRKLQRARRLFARAVETPGGLKIDTIHAFCERLLHLVPFEANVPARFVVLDEMQSAELVAEATANVLAEAASEEDSALRRALDCVSVNAAGDQLTAAIEAGLKEMPAVERAGGLVRFAERLRRELGLKAGEDAAGIEQAMLEDGLPPNDWPGLAEALERGQKTDQTRAASLRAAHAARDQAERLGHYLSVFFTDKGEPRAERAFVTGAVDPDLKDRLLAEQARLARLADRRRAADAFERTRALFTLAAAIHAQVETTKARLGALDFSDLIAKTLGLLSRGDAAWVLYKLDQGIDHVLVDEAQDTNPEQWEILRLITADFTAGAGARGDRVRTLFAVGDPKQSIYGFQGAAPREFETSRRLWQQKVGAAALRFEDVRLTLSFRSARAVLSAVDATFAVAAHFQGLSFEENVVGTVHESARPQAPGLVELWPVEKPAEEAEPDAWTLPVDQPEPGSPAIRTAQRVARAVKAWITRGDEMGRRWRAGDILVLARKRGPAFGAAIRALKEAGVPVAGQDRIEIGDHIAVEDLIAAGRAALLPQDDLTLATALKSPLVGLSEEDLLQLAAGRPDGEPFVEALRRQAEAGDAAAAAGVEALRRWRELAARTGPFGFYAALLGPMKGRARLVARLGHEAGDAIDAFLSFAHGAELTETPSLTTFLARFEQASHQVKRDLESGRDEVRVMTVHGAKGLEAPIVILIDGCEVLGRDPPLIPLPLTTGGALPVWSTGQPQDCAVIAEARAAHRRRGLEEHNRLLYVAMTRARDRLVIAPFTGRKDSPQEAWCEMIRRGLVATARGLILGEAPYGPVEQWRDLDEWPKLTPPADPEALAPIAEPEWLRRPAEPEPEPAPPLSPSGALGAADGPARARGRSASPEARLRGTLIHALLEALPPVAAAVREASAHAYVAARAPGLGPAERSRIVRDALQVLADPALAPLFGPGSRAEVPVGGRLSLPGGPIAVNGQIDRLAVLPGEVLLADYKTTARLPRADEPTPAAYVAQLALYWALLQEIHPGRPVRPYLIWTAGPLAREIGMAELQAALALIKAA